jgi:hypothetical protein
LLELSMFDAIALAGAAILVCAAAITALQAFRIL